MSPAKLAVLVLWVLCAAAWLVPGDSTLATAGRFLFWALVVAHVVELVVFLPRLRRAGGSLGGHVARTLVFGLVHLRTVRAADDARG